MNPTDDKDRELWKAEQEKREELMDMGLDPDDPDPSELAPEGYMPEEDD